MIKNDGGSIKNAAGDYDRAKRVAGEDNLAELMDSMGIVYERQYKYVPGRKFAADFKLKGKMVLVEYTGGIWQRKAHGSITGVLMDNRRLNLASIYGYRMVRFGPRDIEDGTAEKVLKLL